MTAVPHPSRQTFLRSVEELLRLAVSVCGVRFGVARIAGEGPITAGPGVPVDAEEPLARFAASQEAMLVILEDADLQGDGARDIRFYAAVMLLDSAGAPHGTFALVDDRPRSLSDAQRDALLQIAAQIMRDLEMAETIDRLEEERAACRPLIDDAPVAVFSYCVDSARFTYVNAKFAQTLGYKADEILALESVTDIIPEDQRAAVQEMIRRREAGDDREVRYTTKVRCRDGTVLDAEVHSSIADLASGRLVIGVAIDVTSQTAASWQLREREEYFRALTDHLSDVIAIINSDGVLTYVSPSVERVLGHPPEDLLARTGWANVHPSDAERFSAAVSALARHGKFEPSEYRFQHRGGSWRTLEVIASNLFEHPQIHGLVLILHDITDRKRMEQELGQLHRLTSLGRLSAQVAHEFNNVMMGIQPIVEAIRRRAQNDATLIRFTDIINASLKRGKTVTTDILRFGRPAQVAPRSVAVQELIGQAADEIRPVLGEKIKLELSTPDAPLPVRADSAQLTQVLINLALNGRDAMDGRGGTLTLEARPARDGEIAHAEQFVHVAVSDTGSGIASEDLPYIFEPLFTTKQRGTGLGLSVVFQIVAAHEGHISVDSEPGAGTTFHLFIPNAPGTPAEDEAATAHRRRRPQSPRLLLVEDEEAVATGLRWSLEAAGIEVRVVATGAEVMPALAEFRPDVMVLDLSLPDEDGRSVYRRVSAAFPIPVIFSSGHASEADIAQLMQPSRTAFLMKPYATEELLETVDRLTAEQNKPS
jgi:two-component system, cell cycle sensor histidine kinase and response regulator CckA